MRGALMFRLHFNQLSEAQRAFIHIFNASNILTGSLSSFEFNGRCIEVAKRVIRFGILFHCRN